MMNLTAFDLATEVTQQLTWHGNRVTTFALDPTGEVLVTGSADGVVRVGKLWGGEPHLLYGHSQKVTSVAVSPDGVDRSFNTPSRLSNRSKSRLNPK